VKISTSRAVANSLSSGTSFVRNWRENRGFFAVIVSVCWLLCLPLSSHAGPKPVRPHTYGYFDFPTCVRYALVHSEDFLKTRIDIQFRSAELKDAHSELLPAIQIQTQYYISRADKGDPFAVDIVSNNWDPLLALLKIKSYGILVDIGKLNHYEKIADNIAKMAKIFYHISVLEKTIGARRQILALHEDQIKYGKSRLEQGAYDTLTLRSLQNSAREEQMKIADLARERKDKISELKLLMGYHPDFVLPLDTRDAANQILDGFNGNMITFTGVQGANLSLKILAKQEQLQSNKVTGAYVALVPKPLFSLEGISNMVDRTSGLNLAVGVNYTLWDGFRNIREIKKQKLRAEELRIDRSQFSQKLYLTFKNLRGELEGSGERQGFYREQAKLAELKEEKAYLSYKAGNLPYDEYVTRRMERVEAEISSISGVENKVDDLIDLATMAGGLNKYNAAISF
jgi:Outer membrane efflux protein